MAMNDQLSRAFQLIEDDRHDEARSLLQPLIDAKSQDADVWWLYVHALADPKEAAVALDRLMEVDPSYPGASELRRQLAPLVPTKSVTSALDQSDEFGTETDLLEDDLFGEDQDFPVQSERTESGSRRRLLILLVIIVLVAIALFLLLSGGGNDDDGDLEVAGGPTEVETSESFEAQSAPSNTPQIVPTEQATEEPVDDSNTPIQIVATNTIIPVEPTSTPPQPTAETTNQTPTVTVPTATSQSSLSTVVPSETVASTDVSTDMNETVEGSTGLAAVFSEFELVDTQTQFVSTQLGRTELVSLCVDSELRDFTSQSIDASVEYDLTTAVDVEAIALEFVNCEDGSTLNQIGVSLDVLASFQAGDIDQVTYRGSWNVVTEAPQG